MDSNQREEAAPLVVVVDEDNVSNVLVSKCHARDAHILSFSFFFIFCAYSAAQNLESTVNTKGNIGTTSMGILYTSFTLFSVVASPIVRGLGTKRALVLGSTGYLLFIASHLKPSWYTMVPASLYLGFTASIIWVGQGTYLTSAACSHARDWHLHEGTVIGNFNGEFWGMFASTQVVGNLISLFLLGDGKHCLNSEGRGPRDETGGDVKLPILKSCIIFCTKFSDISQLISNDYLWHCEEGNSTSLLFTVFLGCLILGVILMCFLSKREDKWEDLPEHPSLSSILKSVIAPLTENRILLTIPLIAYSGLQQAFVWAEFTKHVITPALGVAGVGGAMAVFGAADAICSLVAGRLTSGISSITWIVAGGASFQTLVMLWLLFGYSLNSGILGTVYPLLMAAMWGVGDGVFNTQLNALLGMLFKRDTEAAFAQLKVWQSGAIAVVFFVSPHISFQVMLIIMVASLVVALAGFLYLTLHVERSSSSGS